MKVTDRDPDFWALDDNETWPQALAAGAVFVLIAVVLYLAIVTAGAVR